MDIKLDDLDLVKRVQDSPDAPVKEIRSVLDLHVDADRSIVELEIQGSGSSVPQDMGREPIRISLRGEVWGVDAKTTIEKLLDKYKARTPFPFSSDIATVAEVNSVMMKDMVLEEAAADANRYVYHLTLREYREPREPVEEETPSQDEGAGEEAKKESDIYDIRGRLLDYTGNPAKAISVLIKGPGGEYRATTDEDGFYELDGTNLPEGKYIVTSEEPAYEDYHAEVEVKKKGK